MKLRYSILFAVLVFVSCNSNSDKTGFVDSARIMSECKAMQVVKKKLALRNRALEKRLERRAKQFKKELDKYQRTKKSISPIYRLRKEKLFVKKQKSIEKEQQEGIQKLQDQTQKEMDSISKIIKKQIENYAKENGYAYIFAGSEGNNLLYAKAEYDLTNSILKQLNSSK